MKEQTENIIMDDSIKREDARRLICSECCIGFCQRNMCRINNRLNEIPAVEVREEAIYKPKIVKLGKGPFVEVQCPACNDIGWFGSKLVSYCPKCGVKWEWPSFVPDVET